MRISPVVSSQVAVGSDAQKHAKLVDAAQQFEAILMQEMLKPMRSGEDSWGGEEKSDAGGDTLSSFGTEAVAKAIAKGGGLGIAKQVVRQVTLEHQGSSEKRTDGY
jgi:Rod binding domain-containing protein